jgi:hypothetical protein
MKYIDKDKIVELLYTRGCLKSMELKRISFVKPNHGNCCYCQTCGYLHDECVCEHNEIIDFLDNLKIIEM